MDRCVFLAIESSVAGAACVGERNALTGACSVAVCGGSPLLFDDNSWTPKQILSMQKGGNAAFNDFLKSYGVDPRTDIQQKYHTPAALLYKERLLAFVEGREPPTELPQVQQMPASSAGSVPEGSQRLPGETDEQYIRRQTILREQAKERMRQKFGSAGRMQGIGSDASYNPNVGGYGRGGAGGADEFAKAGEFLQESLAFFGQQLKKASDAAQQTAQSLQQQEFTRQMKESWTSLQAKVADPTLTEELKKSTAASWETLQKSTASTWSFLSSSANEFFKTFNEGATETSSSSMSSYTTTPQPHSYGSNGGGYGDMGYDQGIDDFVSAPASLQPPVHHASHMQRDSPVIHTQSAPVSSTTRVSSAASPAAAAVTTSPPGRSPARTSPKAADDDFFGSFGLN